MDAVSLAEQFEPVEPISLDAESPVGLRSANLSTHCNNPTVDASHLGRILMLNGSFARSEEEYLDLLISLVERHLTPDPQMRRSGAWAALRSPGETARMLSCQ